MDRLLSVPHHDEAGMFQQMRCIDSVSSETLTDAQWLQELNKSYLLLGSKCVVKYSLPIWHAEPFKSAIFPQ